MFLPTLIQLSIVIATSFWTTQEDESKVVLPSFNYWDLSQDLIRSKNLQSALGVSLQQVAQLKIMRETAGMDVLLDKKSKEMETKGKSNVDLRERALLELDPVVKRELEVILNESQIMMLREHPFKARFRSPFELFHNHEVIEVCKIYQVDLKRLGPILKDVQAKYEKEGTVALTEFTTTFYEYLPERTKPLFVQYIGKCYLDRYEVKPDLRLEDIPFPPRFRTTNALDALEIPDAQTQVGLSTSQIEKLSNVRVALSNRLDVMLKGGEGTFSENLRMAEREMMQILTTKQVLGICRVQAKSEFEFDFAVPFRRAEFVKYLQLSNEEVKALNVLAVAETEDFRSKMKELDHEAFEVLCGALPSQSKERMQKLFKGFW